MISGSMVGWPPTAAQARRSVRGFVSPSPKEIDQDDDDGDFFGEAEVGVGVVVVFAISARAARRSWERIDFCTRAERETGRR